MRRYSYTLFLSVSLLVSVLFAKETTIFGKNDQTSGVSNGTERVEETEKPVEEEMREVDVEKGRERPEGFGGDRRNHGKRPAESE